MTKLEKYAIEYLKCAKELPYGTPLSWTPIEIVLKLIEKDQKEIEGLQRDKKVLMKKYKELLKEN